MSSKYANARPEEFRSAPAGDRERPMCSTPGCKTYVGNGRYMPSFADIVVPSDGIRLCGECYTRGLYAAGKGMFSHITGRQPDLTLDLVKAHWARFEEAERAKEAKP